MVGLFTASSSEAAKVKATHGRGSSWQEQRADREGAGKDRPERRGGGRRRRSVADLAGGLFTASAPAQSLSIDDRMSAEQQGPQSGGARGSKFDPSCDPLASAAQPEAQPAAGRRRGSVIGSLMSRAVVVGVKALVTSPIDDDESRNAQAQEMVSNMFGRGGGGAGGGGPAQPPKGFRRRGSTIEEERAERAKRSSTAKEGAGRLRRMVRRASIIKQKEATPDAESATADEDDKLQKTRQHIKGRQLAKTLALTMSGNVSKDKVKPNAARRGSILRHFVQQKQQTSHEGGAVSSRGNDADDKGQRCFKKVPQQVHSSTRNERMSENEQLDREGVKEGAGRQRNRTKKPDEQADEEVETPLQRTQQKVLRRRLGATLAASMGKAPVQGTLTRNRRASAVALHFTGMLGKMGGGMGSSGGASSFSGGSKSGRASCRRASCGRASCRASCRRSSVAELRKEAELLARIKSPDVRREAAKERADAVQERKRGQALAAYAESTEAAQKATASMTRAELMAMIPAGVDIVVDGRTGRVLPPRPRSLLQRLLTRPPTAFTVKFEHKSAPIQIELLLVDTKDPMGNARKLPASPFTLKAEVDRIDRELDEALLEAERAAAKALVQLEDLNFEGEGTPRGQRSSVGAAVRASGEDSSRASGKLATSRASKCFLAKKASHSVEAPPSMRRLASSEPATSAELIQRAARKPQNDEATAQLTQRLQSQMGSRMAQMDSRLGVMKETKERVGKAVRELPIAARLPAPRPAVNPPTAEAGATRAPPSAAATFKDLKAKREAAKRLPQASRLPAPGVRPSIMHQPTAHVLAASSSCSAEPIAACAAGNEPGQRLSSACDGESHSAAAEAIGLPPRQMRLSRATHFDRSTSSGSTTNRAAAKMAELKAAKKANVGSTATHSSAGTTPCASVREEAQATRATGTSSSAPPLSSRSAARDAMRSIKARGQAAPPHSVVVEVGEGDARSHEDTNAQTFGSPPQAFHQIPEEQHAEHELVELGLSDIDSRITKWDA